MYDCQPLTCAPHSNSIAQAVDNAVRSTGINKNSFGLLLSDATEYMFPTDAILTFLYPKLLHVKRVAHLLHDCAMKVKSHFDNIDLLMAKVKSTTDENTNIQAKFAAIGCQPSPVVTIQGKLVKCCLVFCKEFTLSESNCGKF